jgi:hypothetical protein
MAQTGQGGPDIAPAAVYLEGVAKNLLHRFYGPDGPPWGTPLTRLEDLVLAVQAALAEHLFTLALARQADHLADAPDAYRQCPSCGQPLTYSATHARSTATRAGVARWAEPAAHCDDCRRDFFPQSRSLGIDQTELSPGLLRKVISTATRCRSFAEADDVLGELSGVRLGPKQIERLVHRVGQERVDERDAFVRRFDELPLADKFAVPDGVQAPDLAVVMTDGGRLQIRSCPHDDASASGPGQPPPTEPGAPAATAAVDGPTREDADGDGKKSRHWREDKIGLLLTMDSDPQDADPCPTIPRGFVDPKRMPQLAREIRKQACQAEEAGGDDPAAPELEALAVPDDSTPVPPKPGARQVVASRLPWPQFALVVAAAAWALGFQGARRKAFVGDGSDNNWDIHKRFFGSFVAILDFIPALSYVYAAAQVGRDRVRGWRVYCRWIKWVWGGQVGKVIDELALVQADVGEPQKSDPETHPRVVVAQTLGYLRHHQDKMRYPEYRKQGLPITTSLVESTVKQINHRVKGTEKFWTEEGAEAILQLRADQLSGPDTVDPFWQRRQERATGQRRYRRAKRAGQPTARAKPRGRGNSPSRRPSSMSIPA